MKILHSCLTYDYLGPEMYCSSLAAAQARHNHDVRVVVRESRFLARWKRETEGALVVALPKWLPTFFERWAIQNIMKGFEPDVVHTHLGRADQKAGYAARKFNVPQVSTMHLRWKEDMRNADAVICVANWQKADVAGAKFKGRNRVVWNWLPRQAVASSDQVKTLRDKWGCTDKTFVFGTVGHLNANKGFDLLINSFRAAYPDMDTDVRLIIVGEGAERAKLKAIAGGDSRIIFAGYQQETAAFYEAYDAFVSASRYEPFGLTILEAMAHGCQLVCTRTEGPMEFLQEISGKGQVQWADRGSMESLTKALKAVYAQGRQHITYDLKPFTVERALREIGEVYDEVLQSKELQKKAA